jgi:PAS domain S-box-containing protein
MSPQELAIAPRHNDRPTRVLIVEDESLIALDLEMRLQRAGFEVVGVADNCDDALALCTQHTPDLALLDIYIRPPLDGIETAKALQSILDIPIVFLTAYADDATLARAAKAGPYGYLLKPFDERTLLATITVAMGRFASDVQLRLLGAAVEASRVGIALLDGNERICTHNSALAEALGATDTLLGRRPRIQTADPTDPDYLCIERALTSGEPAKGVVRSRAESGTERWTRFGISPVMDRNGKRTHIILTAVDVTAEKQTREALEARERDVADLAHLQSQLRARADELEYSLDQLRATQTELIRREKLASLGLLVAGVAHDMNTPLGVARTSGELMAEALESLQASLWLENGDPSIAIEALEDSLRLLRSNLDRASNLVRRFSSLAFDQNAETPRTVELGEAIRDVLESLAPLMRRSGLTAQLDAPDPILATLRTGLLAQVITNLVTNAIIHAYRQEAGELALRITRDEAYAVLEVRDHGAGMTVEVLKRAFEPFFTTRAGKGGSGLGLFITHNLVVEGLGGCLDVTSTVGEGTSFTIRVPLGSAAQVQ